MPTWTYQYPDHGNAEYRRFNSDYYTGADIRIYFEDIWVDEITSLQFTMQENVAPIYGYASYTWDRVARGNRIIQGTFNINFKESYYLHSVLNRLESKWKERKSKDNAVFSYKQFLNGLTIEHLLSSDEQTFEEVAMQFEQSLWGSTKNEKIKSQTNDRSQNSYFYPNFYAIGDDGKKNYASYSQPHLREHGFNIVIAYGPYNIKGGGASGGPGTVHTIRNVQLTGVSQIIGLDGRPVEEQYTFIAKDLDVNVVQKD